MAFQLVGSKSIKSFGQDGMALRNLNFSASFVSDIRTNELYSIGLKNALIIPKILAYWFSAGFSGFMHNWVLDSSGKLEQFSGEGQGISTSSNTFMQSRFTYKTSA